MTLRDAANVAPSPSLFGQLDRRQVLQLFAYTGAALLLPKPRRAVAATDWATGGTAAMTAKDTYPNPFTSAPDSCLLVATTTDGPCTTTTDLDREDISEGWTGLPVRLALRVVDAANCTPLAGVTIKIWHTNIEGSYSGQTPNNGMCLKSQSYAANNFFRGVQTTDDEGVAYFDTCFPGWYRGRAVHIHFQVKNGGTSYRVSQLFFPEDITADVFANHAEYSSYGQPDTTFATDNIISGIASSQRDRHILTVERMSDGAMLASKTVTVVDVAPATTPSSTSTPTPTATATPSPEATLAACVGDCDTSDSVSVDEIIKGVNIALGDGTVASCPAFDANASGTVTIEEIIGAVNAALSGCP